MISNDKIADVMKEWIEFFETPEKDGLTRCTEILTMYVDSRGRAEKQRLRIKKERALVKKAREMGLIDENGEIVQAG